jgi:hypothetical protein
MMRSDPALYLVTGVFLILLVLLTHWRWLPITASGFNLIGARPQAQAELGAAARTALYSGRQVLPAAAHCGGQPTASSAV